MFALGNRTPGPCLFCCITNREVKDLLDKLFVQAQIRFGAAVESRWFYDAEACPGFDKPINGMKFKGKDAFSLNTFIFREHGVLIAYLLCGKCAEYIFKEAETDPSCKTPLHAEIEKGLKAGFLKRIGH